MISNNSSAETHFIKQRRNLIGVSLLILFYKVGELSLTKINVLGNVSEIGNPKIVVASLFIFFVYFLWRYYTACREVRGITQFLGACTIWAETKAEKYAIRKYFKNKIEDGSQLRLIERSFSSLKYRVYKNPSDPHSEGKDVKIKWYFLLMRSISWVHVILHTSKFSEYIIPYFLASLAIAELSGLEILSHVLTGITNNQEILSVKQTLKVDVKNSVGSTALLGTGQKAIPALEAGAACAREWFGVCLIKPTGSPDISIFGFSEFVTALALLTLVYTISDFKYKFRLAIAPFHLWDIAFVSMAAIGGITLLVDVWSASLWPIPDWGINHYYIQGLMGLLFLVVVIVWVYFAFINPPIFNKFNAYSYAQQLLNVILRGSETELAIIAHELGRSAKSIVKLASTPKSATEPSRASTKPNEEESEDAEPSLRPKENKKDAAVGIANEILLMMGNRRLCEYIISSSPMTAVEFFKEFSTSQSRLQVEQFVRNLSTAAILNKNSLLYHEDEGYNSGWLGYVRPFSKAIYGDYRLISDLSQYHGSPLHLHHRTAWSLDPQQFEVYARVTLITLESYIKANKEGTTRFHAISDALDKIEQVGGEVWKLDGKTDYYPSELYEKFDIAVKFVKDAIEILDKHSTPPIRTKKSTEFSREDIFDQIAELIFKLTIRAAGVEKPRDTAWSVQYGAFWGTLFSFQGNGKAQALINYRYFRLLWNEINQLSKLPNFKSARALGFALNVMGPVFHRRSYKELYNPLHRLILNWVKRNYLTLKARQPFVAEACMIGSLEFDEANNRITKSYIRGLGLTEPQEYIDLDPARPEEIRPEDRE